ncbi:MAG: PEP-CTERM sorting domain-containing protein [Thiobacillus sp.]
MSLQTIFKLLPTQPASYRHTERTVLKIWGHGQLMALCAGLAMSAAPVGAQENNPEESGIIYEDVNPGGSTENNPEASDIVYEDFPLDGLPEGELGDNPLPVGEQPPSAVPAPGTLALLLAGAAGAMLLGHRRTHRS